MKSKKGIISITQEEYQKLLTHPKWQKKRLEIMQRDEWKCKKCEDTETTLHVHHIEYFAELKPWEYDDKYLDTLCEHCHKEIELLKKEVSHINYDEIEIFKFHRVDTDPMRFLVIRYRDQTKFKQYNKQNEIFAYILIPGVKLNKIISDILEKSSSYIPF